MAPLSPRAAPRHLVSTRRAPPSSPPHLVRVRNPQRLPRTDAGATWRGCGVRRRPAPPTRPAAWEVCRRRPRFPLTGSGCKILYRETKRKAGPQPSPPTRTHVGEGKTAVNFPASSHGRTPSRCFFFFRAFR
jgi:hypothetical protein